MKKSNTAVNSQESHVKVQGETEDIVRTESKGDLEISDISLDETEIEEVENPRNGRIIDNTSPVSPIKPKRVENLVKEELLPEAVREGEINAFETMDLRDSYEDQEFASLKDMRTRKKPGTGGRKARKVNIRPLEGKDG